MATVDGRKIFEQGKTLWRKLTPRRRMLAVGALVAVAGLAAFALRGPTESFSVLFSGLAPEDAGRVLEQLKAQNVPYRIEAGGAAIEVPSAKVHELRITMAQAGLPRGGGVGFELFDKQNFGSSSFVEQMNYHRALQGELARTIMSLDAVERARVHLAMRERSLYRDDDEPPAASVALTLRPGQTLSPAQVRGVVHLMASSVEGLKPERVTIVDERGVALWSGDESADAAQAEGELERTLQRRVREMVERVVGAGHAQVVVTAELDATRTERTEELFDKDRSALRSESRTVDGAPPADASTAGVAGAQGNLPGAPAPTSTPPAIKGGSGRASETRNYEISHVVSKTTSPKVHVKHLNVAVLVDGVHAKPDDPKSPIVPRGAEELTRIGALARAAAGLDAERGDKLEVHSAPFAAAAADEPDAPRAWPKFLPSPRVVWIASGVAELLALALVARALRSKRPLVVTPPLPLTVGQMEKQLDGSAAQPLPALPAPSPRDRAVKSARADVARTARVLSAWLGESSTEGTS